MMVTNCDFDKLRLVLRRHRAKHVLSGMSGPLIRSIGQGGSDSLRDAHGRRYRAKSRRVKIACFNRDRSLISHWNKKAIGNQNRFCPSLLTAVSTASVASCSGFSVPSGDVR